MNPTPREALPPGWVFTNLAEVADVQLGKMLDKAKRTSGTPLPYLRNQNVRWGSFDTSDLFQMPFEEEELDRYSVLPGDLVVCEGGEPGRAAIWEGPTGIRYQKALHRVRALSREALDLRWVLHRLRHDSPRALPRHFTGSTIKHFTRKAFLGYPIPLPPLNEQRRIVERIEALNARSRRAREALDQIPALLERFRQSVLAAAFRGDLTAEWRKQNPDVEPASVLLERIRAERRRRWEEAYLAKQRAKGKEPKGEKWKAGYSEPWISSTQEDRGANGFGNLRRAGWAAVPLEMLAAPERGIPYGIVKTGDPTPGGVPTVRCGDIKDFSIDVSKLKLVHPEIHASYGRTSLRGGEVLLAIRGSVGATAVASCEMSGMNISREVAMIPVLEDVDPRFIMYWLASPGGQQLLSVHVKGVAQSGINLNDLRGVECPLPPLAEQRAIVAGVMHQLGALRHVTAMISEGSSSLAQLDQAILAKAFRGELVPQDPADEPASTLLNRLRAEREANGRTKKRRSERSRNRKPPLATDDPEADPPPHPPRRDLPPRRPKGSTGCALVARVLEALKRDALHRIADHHDVALSDRRSLEAARQGLLVARLGLDAVLEPLKRDELKRVCRALDLDDSGRAKQDLRDRILGTAA